MHIDILSPQGYCAGVTNAINMAKQAKKENPDKDIYVLGMLVHNKQVIDELTNEGITTIFNKEKELEELIKQVPNNSVIVFTAHGHDEKLDTIAKDKNLIIYDATCSKVRRNLERIKLAIKENRQVIYIGEKNHPESNASLSISDKVSFYDTNLDLSSFDNPLVINQTTLNIEDIKEIHSRILKEIPNAEIEDEICPTTRLRQQALKDLDSSYDLIIIVGDQASNNSKKLFEIAKSTHPKTDIVMISKLDDLDRNILKGKEKVAIASGASTPNSTISDIYSYLSNYN